MLSATDRQFHHQCSRLWTKLDPGRQLEYEMMSVMRIVWVSVLAVLLLPLAASAQGRGGGLPSESVLNRNGLTRAWWSHATINSKRDKLLNLVADENSLFVQTSSGIVTAFDAESGKVLWTRQIGVSDRTTYPAITNDDLIFVINGMQLFGVQKRTGDVLWHIGLPGQPSSSAAADTLRIYCGFLDGSLYAFNLKRIAEYYAQGKLPQFSNDVIDWRYRTSKAITVPAIPQGKVVAFASGNGAMYSVTADERRLVYQFETDAPLTAPLVRYKDSVLLASEDFNFYSMNIVNGKPGWQHTAGVVIRRAPVLIDDEVYLLPHHSSMIKLSAETGHQFWVRPRIDQLLAASTDRLYTVDRGGNLVILARATGETLGGFPLDRFDRNLTNDSSDRIFLATESGLVMCLHERTRNFPRFHRHPDRQPLLPEFATELPGPPPAGDAESADEMPAEEATAEEKPDEEMPADETPAEESSDDDSPAEEVPAEEPPAAEETDDAPVEETPAEKPN